MEEKQIQEIIKDVRNRLEKLNREKGIELSLEGGDYKLEDEWL